MDQNEIDILKRALNREKLARKNAEKILEEKSAELYHLSSRLKESNFVINNIAKSILGKTNYYDIAWEILINIANYLDTEDCVIYLINEETNSMEQIAAYGSKVKDKEILNPLVIPIGEGIVGSVAKSGIPELIHDTSKDSRYIKDIEYNYSEITVPIVVEGHIIGIIDSEHPEKYFFNEGQLVTLINISRVIAMQLNNAISLEKRKEAEGKYIKINKELAKKNEALEEYAHIVSHDLKSPLRSISALLSWIKEDNEELINDSSKVYFDNIDKSLEHMENLISDVLIYSSISFEQIKFTSIDIKKLLNEIVDYIFVPEHVTIEIGKMPPKIKADYTQFKQLFQNLITNAVKFIDKDKGKVKILYESDEFFYKFSISDNGIGIDEKYHDKIFDVFQSLTKDSKSSGIGLSIVKKIINLYGGKIWVESKLGEGTTFYFTIKK